MALKEIITKKSNDYRHNGILLRSLGSLGIRNVLVRDYLLEVGKVFDLMFNSVRDYNLWRRL